MPFDENEENNDAEIMLPTKRSGCMIRSDDTTPTVMIDVHKYTTFNPPKLIVMGCIACYTYVMIPENHGICPKCGQDKYIIDVAARAKANKKKVV